ncbi:MAG TPA: hypothetical protein VGC41_09980 [Kofleriaceae bacterium]
MSVILGLVLACSQPHSDPKTGEVVHECAQPGGPKVEAPVKAEPAPTPEAPPVEAKKETAPKREQPCPQGDRPAPGDRAITAGDAPKSAPSA